MRFALPFLLWAVALPCAAQVQPQRMYRIPVFPPDIVSQPERAHVEIDNETTRVLRIALQPDGQIAAHDDRAGVLVCLTECHLRLLVLGLPVEVHLRAGQTQWMKADRRSMRNIGGDAVELLYIESKKPQK